MPRACTDGQLRQNSTSTRKRLASRKLTIERLDQRCVLAAGVLDNSFDADGIATTDLQFFEQAQSVAVQADGKIVSAGTLNSGAGTSLGLVRYNANGSLDNTFGTGGKVQTDFAGIEESANSVVIATDGKIIVAGTSNTLNVGNDFLVARYNANGTLDTTFGGDGHVVISLGTLRQTQGLSVVVQSSGKVTVGGSYEAGFGLARLNANGTLDTTFDGDGKLETTFATAVEALVVLPDGKILAGGYGQNDFAIAKFNSNGSYDNSFDGDGRTTIDFRGGFDIANAMAIQPDGKIVLAGSALVGNSGIEQFAVARLLPGGGLDTTFEADGKVTTTIGPVNNAARSVVVQSNGRIVIVGAVFDPGHFSFDTALIRYDANGSLDSSFDGDGIAVVDISGSLRDDVATAAAIVPGGNIVVVGSVSPNGSDFFAAEFVGDPDYQAPSDRDTAFARAGLSRVEFNNVADISPEFIADSAVQPDGKIVFVKDHVVGRLNPDGSPDVSFGWGQGIYFSGLASSVAIQPDGKIIVAGYRNSPFGGNPYAAIGRYNADGSVDTTFGFSVGFYQLGFPGEEVSNVSVALQADGKYILSGNVSGGGGEFRYTNIFVARFMEYGLPDNTFDGDSISRPILPSSYALAGGVAIQSDGKIVVGGSINTFASGSDFLAFRLNTNGSLDTSFDGDGIATVNIAPLSNDFANDIELQGDGKIVLAGSTDYSNGNSVTDFALVRLTTSGAIDNSFDFDGRVTTTFIGPNASQVAYSLAIASDGKIIVAGLANSSAAVARYFIDGSLDNNFASNGRFLSNFVYPTVNPNAYLTAYSISVQANGKVVTGGGYYDGSSFDYALMRLDPGGALDTSFNYTLANDGYVVHDFNFSSDIADAIAIQPDGKVLVAGYVSNGTSYDFGIARYNVDGSLDAGFNGDGKVVTSLGAGDDIPMAMALTSDGRIVVVGYTTAGFIKSMAISVYFSTGDLDTSFSGDGLFTLTLGTESLANSVAVQADGKLLVGGSTNFFGTQQFAILRLNLDGSFDGSLDGDGLLLPGFGSSVYSIKSLPDGKILAVGNEVSTDAGNFALAKFNADGTFDTTFDGDGKATTDMASLGDTAYAAEVQADGKIVVVGVANTGSVRALAIARYNADGSLDTTFDTDGKVFSAAGTGDNYATSVAIQANGKIIVGGLTRTLGANNNSILLRLNSNGSLDSTFDGDGIRIGNLDGHDSVISAIAVAPNGQLYAAGYVLTGYMMDGNGGLNYDFTLERLYADNVDVTMVSATTNGLDQLTITYNVTGRNAAPFYVGVYLSPDTIASGYQAVGNDTLISRRLISRAANLTVGPHRVTFAISSAGLLLPDLTATPVTALLDQRLLLVLDDNNQLGEMDAAAYSEDNTLSFQGAYHQAGGNVVAFGTEAADTISVTQVGAQLRLALPGGVAYNYTATDVSRFVIRGLSGDDRLQATNIAKPMLLVGGNGNDTLIGGSASDTLYGFSGADSLTGGGGNDLLSGGDNNDAYNFGNAIGTEVDTLAEVLNGGADALNFSTLTITTGVTVNLASASTTLGSHAGRTLNVSAIGQAAFLENVIGSIGNDTLTGNAAGNVLRGGDGNDVLSGGGANDTLDGGNGDDTLDGGADNDVLEGGAGSDALTGGTGSDRYIFKTANTVEVDTLFEAVGGGVDWLDFSSLLSNDALNIDLGVAGTVIGSHNNRTIQVGSAGGAAFFENVTGGAGNDTLRGNSAANRLEGGLGNDLLDGRLGTDTLDGGPGTDTALGGEILLNFP